MSHRGIDYWKELIKKGDVMITDFLPVHEL